MLKTSILSDTGHVSCSKHFLSPQNLSPVGVLSTSAVPCQDTQCQMLHEQQQTISMRSNVREWTHVLLMNTPCSHVYSVCATGVNSGLATKVTLTSVVGRGRWESLLHGAEPAPFIFVPQYVTVVGFRFKWQTRRCKKFFGLPYLFGQDKTSTVRWEEYLICIHESLFSDDRIYGII
jgi:hypothetical protein